MPDDTITLTRTADRVTVHIPMTLRCSSGHRRIIAPEIVESAIEEAPRQGPPTKLAIALAKAHQWKIWLDDGRYRDVNDLAHAMNLDWSYVHRLLRLTLLAPDIVEAIVDGREPEGLTLNKLRGSLPLAWAEQREWMGMG
jgi:hypothetical protein